MSLTNHTPASPIETRPSCSTELSIAAIKKFKRIVAFEKQGKSPDQGKELNFFQVTIIKYLIEIQVMYLTVCNIL